MNDHGSAIVAAAEAAWAEIQARHPEVPDVVIRLGVSEGTALGHFASNRLRLRGLASGQTHEVMLSAVRCGDGGEGAFCTLLHEAVHAFCHGCSIQDTSRQGRYHNKRFQSQARAFGLNCELHSATFGLALTTLPPETRESYQDVIAGLDAAIQIHEDRTPAKAETPGGREAKAAKPKAVCECDRKIPGSALQGGPIICGLCETEFTLSEEF